MHFSPEALNDHLKYYFSYDDKQWKFDLFDWNFAREFNLKADWLTTSRLGVTMLVALRHIFLRR